MICLWQEFLNIIPPWLRREMGIQEQQRLQELRLRVGAPPELNYGQKSLWLNRIISQEDVAFCVNSASQYSPWASETVAQGYLAAPGGHRVGLCGQGIVRQGVLTGLRDISSVCIRVARDFPGAAEGIHDTGSILILGAPGWGKTTLLRDLIRKRAGRECVCVVDERGELFPEALPRGKRMDVMRGVPKQEGMEMALRTMGPDCIAVDEITSQEDCSAILHANRCGVSLLATAHAGSLEDYLSRKVYAPLIQGDVFDRIIQLRRDKSFREERVVS